MDDARILTNLGEVFEKDRCAHFFSLCPLSLSLVSTEALGSGRGGGGIGEDELTSGGARLFCVV